MLLLLYWILRNYLDIDIFRNGLIDIDIDVNIFKNSRYRYFQKVSIYIWLPVMHSSLSTEAASGRLSRRKTQTWSCKPEDDQSDFWFNKKKLHLNLTVKRESSEVHGASNVVIQSGRIADHTRVVQPDEGWRWGKSWKLLWSLLIRRVEFWTPKGRGQKKIPF